MGALLVAAGLRPPCEHALISLLALNGLRVSEATGADIEHLGVERGHRTLTITRKRGKVVTIPLAHPAQPAHQPDARHATHHSPDGRPPSIGQRSPQKGAVSPVVAASCADPGASIGGGDRR